MRGDNICKFILPDGGSRLQVYQFIRETRAAERGEELTLPHCAMYLVAEGKGVCRQGLQKAPLLPGTLFFTFANVPFAIDNGGGLKYLYISFGGGRGEELLRRFGITAERFLFGGFQGLLPLWSDSLLRANGENIDLLSESLLLYSFSMLKNACDPRGNPVAEVLTWLEENFTRRELTLETAAKELGYNAKYLSHVFKKRFGTGFTQYVKLRRIRHAVLLMNNGVTAIKNVALLCGFADPLYFSRVFTQTVGVSPRQYLSGMEKTGVENAPDADVQ